MISIRDLNKNYGAFQALKDLSFEIADGQCVGLLGSNGAGKSTTIRIITGQLLATSGRVEVDGLNPATEAKKLHAHIGYIPDAQSIYEDLSVWQNIDIFRQLQDAPIVTTEEIILMVGLKEKLKTKVKHLSKGLRQRVLIARALVHQPKIILLDEPTTGLDPSSAESIYRILESLKKNGSTILLTTHLMNDVDRLCDHIVFINEGQKVEEGSPESLRQKYGKKLEDIFVHLVGEKN